MVIALRARRKLRFIDGSCTKAIHYRFAGRMGMSECYCFDMDYEHSIARNGN